MVHGSGVMAIPSPFTINQFGGLAQLARAPALQAGGQRFESVILHDLGVGFRRLVECGSKFFTLHLKEIFDILTHKTVSKDFKSQTEVD